MECTKSNNTDYDLSVVIPAHNESENLKILLPRLRTSLANIRSQIVIVDNASNDDTGAVLDFLKGSMPNLDIIKEPCLGYGRTVIMGLKNAHGKVIAIMRADNQEKPEDLVRMYKYLQMSGLEFCKAIRKNRLREEGITRVIVSAVYNTLFGWFFCVDAKDINASPKIFTKKFYAQLKPESADWFIDAEMVIKARKLGYEIGEMEILYSPRLNGRSNVRFVHILEFLRNMWRWHRRVKKGEVFSPAPH